jgi:guanyl-specific ribonuclease Sa
MEYVGKTEADHLVVTLTVDELEILSEATDSHSLVLSERQDELAQMSSMHVANTPNYPQTVSRQRELDQKLITVDELGNEIDTILDIARAAVSATQAAA